MPCLDDEIIVAFAEGALEEPSRVTAERHLQVCTRCSLFVAEVAKSFYPQTEASLARQQAGGTLLPRLSSGMLVGRYVIEKYLAHGSGGTVYEAQDSQLQRRIALKLLEVPAVEGQPADAVRGRLLREAQVMARLSHPNVVQVHDAGVFGDQVFIVTELVAGETLTRWLRQKPRAWREILAVFVPVGEGLSAIHEAGLVHGDVKPDNVLMGRDERPRITDFGLARIAGAENLEPAYATSGSSSSGVTVAGGTLPFMAPECVDGAAPDASADQYSFCVALFIALFGRHPSDSVPVALAAPATSRHARSKAAGGAPPALLAALLQGLGTKPEERHPSMPALLEALRRASRAPSWWRRRGPIASMASAALVLLALGAFGLRAAFSPAARTPTCGDGIVRAPIEECDDGNQRDGDGCTSTCRRCEGPDRFFHSGTGTCYVVHRTPEKWESARRTCEENGSVLVTYQEGSQLDAVGKAFRISSLWTGLRRERTGGAHVWYTGEPLLPSLRRPLEDEIALRGREESPNCVRQVERKWRGWPTTVLETAQCSERHPFVCRDVEWTVDPRTGHAYRAFVDPQQWIDARRACERTGGHLATLTSQAEQDLVSRYILVEAWIGVTDAEREGSFVWVTGEPFDFATFAPKELESTSAAKNDCVVLGHGHFWHDRRCTDRNYYLCEIDR